MRCNSNTPIELKVCGLNDPENIAEVAKLNPQYLGFIFFEKSPRHLTQDIPKLPNNIKKIGVFVNASLDDIKSAITAQALHGVQLHGKESPEFCAQLKAKCPELIIIKVFSIKDHFNFDDLQPYIDLCHYFLFDTKGKYAGGNGYAFDWTILNNYPFSKPYFLSGGIGLEVIDNLNAFLMSPASAYCKVIDVNSAFETIPGTKDTDRLKTFINLLNRKLK